MPTVRTEVIHVISTLSKKKKKTVAHYYFDHIYIMNTTYIDIYSEPHRGEELTIKMKGGEGKSNRQVEKLPRRNKLIN